ncbi:MAG: hypothetical protein KGL39_10495 [Patescibacteria group bacterium]|nr:hypothetical protein [Patescibacteria group bacterium]
MASKAVKVTDTKKAIDDGDIPGEFNEDRTAFRFPTVESRDSRGTTLLWTLQVRLLRDGEPVAIEDDLLTSPAEALGPEYQGEITVESRQEDGKIRDTLPTYVTAGKNIGRKNATNVITQAFRDALGKFNKQNKRSSGKKTNAIDDLVVSPFVCMGAPDAKAVNFHPPPMLVKRWGDTKAATITAKEFAAGTVTLQQKYDGVRCPATLACKKAAAKGGCAHPKDAATVVMYSRTGGYYPGSASIRKELLPFLLNAPQVTTGVPEKFLPVPKPTHKAQWAYKGPFGVPCVVLDGELYKHGKPLNWISGQARKEKDSDLLEFHVYDCFFPLAIHYGHDMTGGHRQEYLDAIFAANEGKVKRIIRAPNFKPKSEAEMREKVREFLRDDYEGGIIRKDWEGYMYSFNNYHSANLLKIKPIKDSEFPIVGFTQGTKGKDVGAIIWICEVDKEHVKDPKDKEFSVVPMDMSYQTRYALFRCLSAKVDDPKAPGKKITRFERDIKRNNLKMTVVYPNRSAKTGKPTQPKSKIIRSYEAGEKHDPMHKILVECGMTGGDEKKQEADEADGSETEEVEADDAEIEVAETKDDVTDEPNDVAFDVQLREANDSTEMEELTVDDDILSIEAIYN